MISENDLVEGCRKGDRGSQRQLYDLYSKKMMAVAMRYSKFDQEAEDIIQEAFIKIFDKISTFRGESRLDFWIKRIVVNTALNHQRSKLYLFPMTDINDVTFTEDSDFSLSDFNFKELLKMIQRLPAGCQTVFNLYAIEGYTHKEIAEELNISEGTSKSQYSRARALLQDQFKKEEKLSYGQAK
ncbi:RNA polymerase sigma factor [Fulvivirga sediminis]|uniref:RNA polymerase sigma factor n=1 Tax=Fulvivirga sediminis TaxID=2803949 RepID=A0A937K088_9BACT|nr:RNA polymerase sigma factor [Fulvivirga sediminis]MBL3657414.1 RNA polymerase sigma factor [Fulvivirga sediminis]